jgi:predicted aconitase
MRELNSGVLEMASDPLYLSIEERAMLSGEEGPGVQKAMEIVTALGRIYDARRLVPVGSVQVAGVSYKNLGDAGLEFLGQWADQGAKVRVHTTLNPAGMDLQRWRDLGIDPAFAECQTAVIQAFARMGVRTTCTCTPYLVGNRPGVGEHVAWAESSAVSYANTVLGARTNREGGPSALAAAITGRTAAYGLHLDRNRRATLQVDVRCAVRESSDFGALGYLVGQAARNRVPFFRGLEVTEDAQLKALGAAMAASGAVALYHVDGVTPEAVTSADVLAANSESMIVDDLVPGYAALGTGGISHDPYGAHHGSTKGAPIDLVWIGCPHASIEEIQRVATLLAGRRVRSSLWITVAGRVRQHAAEQGVVAAIEASGGRVVADTCVVVAPVRELGFRTMATSSGKGAFYGPSHAGLTVYYGTLAECIETAVEGRWIPSN